MREFLNKSHFLTHFLTKIVRMYELLTLTLNLSLFSEKKFDRKPQFLTIELEILTTL
jgi:hypothetical protein